jgi:hypothetical protein
MPDKKSILNTENLEEWMHSTGYLLPATSLELARFELLHKDLSHSVDYSTVDPFAIINGTWKMRHIVSEDLEDLSGTIDGLRMAARKHLDLPEDIIRRIKNNHLKNNGSDSSDD